MNDNMRVFDKFSMKTRWVIGFNSFVKCAREARQFYVKSELKWFLTQKRPQNPSFRLLQLQIETGKQGAGKRKSVSIIDLLGQVVSYRNISQDGHGRKRSSVVIEQNAKMLREAFIELMSEDNPITNWLLFHVDSNERRIEGGVKFGKRELWGVPDYESTIEDSDSPLLSTQ